MHWAKRYLNEVGGKLVQFFWFKGYLNEVGRKLSISLFKNSVWFKGYLNEVS